MTAIPLSHPIFIHKGTNLSVNEERRSGTAITLLQLIVFLIAYTTAIIGLSSAANYLVIDSRINALVRDLDNRYEKLGTSKDSIQRPEYEARREENRRELDSIAKQEATNRALIDELQDKVARLQSQKPK